MKIEPRIVRFEFDPPRPKPTGLLDPTPAVIATFDDGTQKELFNFYPDEIQFHEGELVGLTEAEAHELRRQKDLQCLRS
jgi:hypothetical protein